MSSDKEYMREYMRKYSAARRERVIGILGGKCDTCGSNQDLDVHHRDPKDKSFTLGRRWHRAWKDIEQELPKCHLLCGDCHRQEHRSTASCWTVQRYWRGCRCVECRAARAKYQKEYRSRVRGVNGEHA